MRPREKLVESESNIFLLSCQSSGFPPPTIHWYRNGRQITATGKGRVSIISTGLAEFCLWLQYAVIFCQPGMRSNFHFDMKIYNLILRWIFININTNSHVHLYIPSLTQSREIYESYFPFSMFYIFLITGDLLFTLPKKSDTGLYSCEVVNEHGMDMASTKVVIKGII